MQRKIRKTKLLSFHMLTKMVELNYRLNIICSEKGVFSITHIELELQITYQNRVFFLHKTYP